VVISGNWLAPPPSGYHQMLSGDFKLCSGDSLQRFSNGRNAPRFYSPLRRIPITRRAH
jgi:hypothetical protein